MRPLAAGEQPKCRMLYAGFGEDVKDRTSPKVKSVDATQQVIKARFPLGSKFFFELTNATANGEKTVESQFELTKHKVSPDTQKKPNVLFPDLVAVQMNRGATVKQAYFRATHLGTVLLSIPAAGGTVKVEITVTRPQSLGDDPLPGFPDLDDRLIDVGQERGIPPHFLRGQIAHESRTDRSAYRYEPLV